MTIRVIYSDWRNELIPDVVSMNVGTHHLTVVRRRTIKRAGKGIFRSRRLDTSHTVFARRYEIKRIEVFP